MVRKAQTQTQFEADKANNAYSAGKLGQMLRITAIALLVVVAALGATFVYSKLPEPNANNVSSHTLLFVAAAARGATFVYSKLQSPVAEVVEQEVAKPAEELNINPAVNDTPDLPPDLPPIVLDENISAIDTNETNETESEQNLTEFNTNEMI